VCHAQVIENERRMKYNVAVNLDYVVTSCLLYGFVPDRSGAKSFVRLPNVAYGYKRFCSHLLDQHSSLIGGAIIGNKYFIGQIPLIEDAAHRQFKIAR
jgi:hypothetical protein